MALLTLTTGAIEYAWIGGTLPQSPPIVMLHEGLGSLCAWREFPLRLAERTQRRVLAYSRYGYGESAPVSGPRKVAYMHDEAWIVLPALLQRLGIKKPILFGHSDGASIALIHAARHPVECLVALAPHVFVEACSVQGIEAAKAAYATTDLRRRLARHHVDVDGAFRGWNDAWLSPDFRSWNIEALLPDIECPVLVIQGAGDEYGTHEQLRRIQQGAREVELLLLPSCGHSPHRDEPEKVLASVQNWLNRRAAKRPAPQQ
ncbi:MAG TPA: alpha/beta hydrolase [Steroidobacteraceae bacterium]|jgi:pimeloyl-ACP methyl ester carboxylesterase